MRAIRIHRTDFAPLIGGQTGAEWTGAVEAWRHPTLQMVVERHGGGDSRRDRIAVGPTGILIICDSQDADRLMILGADQPGALARMMARLIGLVPATGQPSGAPLPPAPPTLPELLAWCRTTPGAGGYLVRRWGNATWEPICLVVTWQEVWYLPVGDNDHHPLTAVRSGDVWAHLCAVNLQPSPTPIVDDPEPRAYGP